MTHIPYVFNQTGLTLPVSQRFQKYIRTLAEQNKVSEMTSAIVLNFRDPDYNVSSGGFHPVEMRFIRQQDQWLFDYVTDFSYIGQVYPELEKDIDFSWSGGYVYHHLAGDIEKSEQGALWKLWESNFMEYLTMGVYQVTVTEEGK